MDSITNQNSGLLRFRSAPANFSDSINLDSGAVAVDKGGGGGGGQTEELISRFMNTGNAINGADLGFRAFDRDKIPATVTEPAGSYGLPPHYPRQSRDGSNYNRIMSSMAMDQQIIQPNKSINSTLLRQSSSPAGLFAHLSAQNQNGYASEKPNKEISPSTKRLKSQLSFPSRLSSSSSSSLGILPQISEIGNEGIGSDDIPDDDGNHQSSNGDVRFYSAGFTFGPWNGNESSHFSDNEAKLLFSDSQNGDIGNRFQPLSHHLSLPKSFSHINQAEKFLEFQDSVPCKIRAKRGCATHPRSIAERVRRTRISERMRKLQELVPNMDKQTNTADMLEFAVDYIKDLQREYKTLSDSRAKCKCLSMQKPVANHIV